MTDILNVLSALTSGTCLLQALVCLIFRHLSVFFVCSFWLRKISESGRSGLKDITFEILKSSSPKSLPGFTLPTALVGVVASPFCLVCCSV